LHTLVSSGAAVAKWLSVTEPMWYISGLTIPVLKENEPYH